MWIQVENGDLLNTDHIVRVQKQLIDGYHPKVGYKAVALLRGCHTANIYGFEHEEHCDQFITRFCVRINLYKGGDHDLKALVDDIMEDDS